MTEGNAASGTDGRVRTTDAKTRRRALTAADGAVRLRAALDAGTRPDPADVELLVARCRVEPDFFVRDMLTWSLTRHRADVVVPLLVAELESPVPQARSQALHTLSKIGDRSVWPHITEALLCDEDDEIARAAWRAAAVLVPAGDEERLAEVLATQLGRGAVDRAAAGCGGAEAGGTGEEGAGAAGAATEVRSSPEVQRSLSRALVGLGAAAEAPLTRASTSPREPVRLHAEATLRLREDPDAGFAGALEEAKRVMALGAQRWGREEPDAHR